MLAPPLRYPQQFSPQHSSDDHRQYRPAPDLNTFQSLLPGPAVEFVEGSSSGALAVADGKYEPINASPKTPRVEETPKSQRTPIQKPDTPTPSKTKNVKSVSLHSGSIDTSWPAGVNIGSGLYNTGNTCFLNSALQCLLHTPPLLHLLARHRSGNDPCRVKNGVFCMSCALRGTMLSSHGRKNHSPFSPSDVNRNLHHIAKHMKRGRQEDSHEFLRYAIDALQKSCLADQPPKLDAKIAETTWVHGVFGGKLRSRVTCHNCEHNSDTFDSILDLSVDIHGQYSVRDALRNFVAVDYLKGADKYKCDKCKQKVVAEKRFTIHEAPVALTIHLKRFSPLGRKIGHPVRYDERLSLGPYMSKGQYGPTYSLYGIISHAGGGPNSGHYYAHVKSASGPWYEMNDESVTRVQGVPTSMKNAYMLFYIRDKGQALEQAVASKGLASPNIPARVGVAASMKKRKILDSDDEDVLQKKEKDAKKTEEKEKRPFIGPILPPSTPARSPVASPTVQDPQAESLKRKIQAAAKPTPARLSTALQSLSQYNDDDDDDDLGEKVETDNAPPSTPATQNPERSSPTEPPASSSTTSPTSIPTTSFYGSGSANGKKRKSPEDDDDAAVATREYAHTPLPERSKGYGAYISPFSRLSSSGDKHNKNRYGRKKRIII